MLILSTKKQNNKTKQKASVAAMFWGRRKVKRCARSDRPKRRFPLKTKSQKNPTTTVQCTAKSLRLLYHKMWVHYFMTEERYDSTAQSHVWISSGKREYHRPITHTHARAQRTHTRHDVYTPRSLREIEIVSPAPDQKTNHNTEGSSNLAA